MRRRLLHLWDKLHSSYWFVPAIMMLGAIVLAVVTLWADRRFEPRDLGENWWLYAGGTDGAREVVATVTGSIITVAGVVFSITILILTQASQQFGPRLLRNFMSDRGNQVVLGTFVATFVYGLLILRSVDQADLAGVPHLSVTVTVLLAITSICVLIYFIHHVSYIIQAPQLVAAVWSDIDNAVKRMFPENLGRGGRVGDQSLRIRFPEAFHREAQPVQSPFSGYVQAIDEETMMRVTVDHDLRMQVLCRPGDFVVRGAPLVLVWPWGRVDEKFVQTMQQTFIVGSFRTSEQDVEFAILQMVEIAVRSLSPSLNDPFTASTCIDWLGDALCRIARDELHSPYRYDQDYVLRIIARVSTFAGLVDAAFDQIRQNARSTVSIPIRLLESIARIAPHLKRPEQREPLLRHARSIQRHAQHNIEDVDDQLDVSDRYRLAVEALSLYGLQPPRESRGT